MSISQALLWGIGWSLVFMVGAGGQPYGQSPRLNNKEMSQLLDELFDRMDPRVRPDVDGGSVRVRCGIYVLSFSSISDVNMDYNMDIHLRLLWEDPRLSYTNTTHPVVISGQLTDKIWTPDLYFPTEKNAAFHDVTAPNKMMRIFPNGTVVHTMRLTLTLACPMDLSHFPMDEQECVFMMESYSLQKSELRLSWFDHVAVELADDIELPQFDLRDVTTVLCSAREYKTGSYDCVNARFRLERQYGFFMLQTYIPSILIVIISWVGFWIDKDAVPARISLSVTTVLTMATQLSASMNSIPVISYPKAIDIWMSTCIIFVFGALIEYAYVNALTQRERKRLRMQKERGKTEHKATKEEYKMDLLSIRKSFHNEENAHMLDKISRVIFPLAFALFNVIYWPYFAT